MATTKSLRTTRSDGLLQKKFRITIKGYSKQFVVYGHDEFELFQKEAEKREEILRGIEKLENPSVSEYFERWEKGRDGSVSEATLRTQNKFFGVIEQVVIPDLGVAFGDIKVKEVDIEILRAVQSSLKETRKSQTVNDYMNLVKHVFSDAMKERIIDYNPCVLLKNLKKTEERARDTHHRALSLEEQKVFFNCDRCKSSYYYNVFRFAINTGMRIGEIGALRMSDISNDLISVERTITRLETGAYVIGEDAKTAAGRRVIPMTDSIRSIIADQKKKNKQLDGNVVGMNDLLFKAAERGLLMSTPVDREIKRICAVAGLKPFTMHALRATFATRCIESGMNPKTLQEILGHANFNLTMSLYGHALTDTKRSEMESVVIAI